MAEIQLTRIKSIYGEIKGYLEGLPQQEGTGAASGPFVVPTTIGKKFNDAIDELTRVSNTDYSRFKVNNAEGSGTLNIREVRPSMHGAVCRLEEEFNFGRNNDISTPAIIINNKNQNEISVQVNYSLSQLIEESKDESGEKLRQLEKELDKPNKSWDTIKPILIWILNFSKELFIKILPILLEKRI